MRSSLGGFAPACCGSSLDHHERLDGKGYPRGADRADLDLETRILAVCDVYDALVSDRVYRAAWPTRAGDRRCCATSRRRFDPRCVDALERVLAPGWVADIHSARPGGGAAAAGAAARLAAPEAQQQAECRECLAMRDVT